MRVVRFLIHNWPLKVAAIVLAIILYVTMVILQNARVFPGQVAIEPVNMPTDAVLLDTTLPSITNIRYIAPADVAGGVGTDSFHASVDLSKVRVSETNPNNVVKVDLTVDDPRIQIVDYDPQQITVQIDPLVRKSVPVSVTYGSQPTGISVGVPTVSQGQVTVFGPSSKVKLVSAAQARVLIQASALDINQDVDLVAVDASLKEVPGVEFTPPRVHVNMEVHTTVDSKEVPVQVVLSGSPAPGYVVASFDAKPLLVRVRGEAAALNPVEVVPTKPVSIANASSDVTQTVALDVPKGIEPTGSSSVQVTVHLRVLQGTLNVTAAVVASGARSDMTYAFSQSAVVVTLGGSQPTLNALDTSAFVVTTSLAGLGPGSHVMSVSVTAPPGVRILAVAPAQVTVVVSPVATPSPPPVPSPTSPPSTPPSPVP